VEKKIAEKRKNRSHKAKKVKKQKTAPAGGGTLKKKTTAPILEDTTGVRRGRPKKTSEFWNSEKNQEKKVTEQPAKITDLQASRRVRSALQGR